MKKILFLNVLILLLLMTTGAAGSAKGENVFRATLANGLQVVIIKNTLAPVVATQINYRVGSNEAPDGFPGMAHAQEHMMFRGSPGLTADQLAGIMALMGGDSNADTQQTVTRYYFTVPKSALETALRVEAIRMRDSLDAPDLWERERGAIEQEVARDLSSPEYQLFMQLLEKMFAGTPYAHDALGTRPSFQQTTATMLKKFHKTWYGPNNAILIIVGDVNAAGTLAMVKKHFAAIPRRPTPARPPVHLQPPESAHIALDSDLPYGLSVAAYRLPGYASPDYAAGVVLADILAGRRGNLYALVPDGKALFADFDAEILPEAGMGLATAGFPQDGDGAGLINDMKKVVDGYVQNGFPDDLVEAAKRHEISNARFRKNSISGLADAWSQALAVEGRTSPDDDIEAIKRVTTDDVNRVAREYLKNDRVITAVLNPQPTGKPVASKGFGGGESFAPGKTKWAALPRWAKRLMSLPGIPASGIRPVDRKLANGIRLIVLPENISETITVIGQVKHNAHLQETAGKEGVGDLLENLFSYGTVSLDRLAFQKAQDDIAADISAGTSFSLRVQPEYFDRGMELLADNLLHPALPEQAFAVVREESAGALRGRLQSPGYRTQKALREALFPAGDPALREATPETVSNLSLADVKAYYAGVFRPDMTTIVMVGQVTAKEARRVVEKYFGSWKAEGAKPVTDLAAIPPNRASSYTVTNPSRIQDEVILAETVGITRLHPDYYFLELGNTVLSGAFYASRLYRDLRENAGLVYTVESSLEAGRHRSLFNVAYGCDPPNVARARAMIEQNLRNMQKTPVALKELLWAKILLINRIPLGEASTDRIAAGMLSRSLAGLPLDEPVVSAKRYRKASAAQLRDVFKKWIRPDAFVQVVEGSMAEQGK